VADGGHAVLEGELAARVDQNPANKNTDNLSGRLSRAKWKCWAKRVLRSGDKVDRFLQQAWGSDKEWDRARVDDQQGKPHR